MAFNIRLKAPYQAFTLEVDMTLPTQGVTAIFGPSGSGKTTLLRAIAGLHKANHAALNFNGHDWQTPDKFMAPHKRPIGYVFQESSLFDHMTVTQILAYGRKRAAKPLSAEKQAHIIDLLGITPLLRHYPAQLSGGERQRVAIAAALLPGPELLLMDEPMASLDFARKKEILGLLERLKSDLQIPLIYVSHNIDEVTRLADHLVILEGGRVQQQGPLAEILRDHTLLNHMSHAPFSLLFGKVAKACSAYNLTEVNVGSTLIRMPQLSVIEGQEIRLHLAAKDVSLALFKPEKTSILNIIEGHITDLDPPSDTGQCLVHLRLGSADIQALISAYSCHELALTVGKKVFAQIKAVSVVQ